ncbi:sterol desaturase family protein [Stylonychia lemnae]|uniref:Sterol desaturase family protein n=1 Tax=Stylonychia lemnae TaxID=5949 RepID=A0A078A947_STYLE|nr:sterol desaturase family protein [Stylonychia lemnae]|eukprot:CDW78371.1 sterol desaturase family protein [Stylonychia lemnae]
MKSQYQNIVNTPRQQPQKYQRSFSQIFVNEENTFQQKGLGLLVAATISATYFLAMPYIGKEYIWPRFLELDDYLQWPKWKMYFVISMIFTLTFIPFANFVYYLIYHFELPFFEQYKVTATPWPWQENKEEWNKLLTKAFKLYFFNYYIVVPIGYFYDVYDSGFDPKFRFDLESFPTTTEIFSQVCIMMLVEDFSFYFIHWFMHNRYIYPYVHKRHHEFRVNVACCFNYFHPIDLFLEGMLPTAIGHAILGKRMHYYTYFCWYIFRVLESMDGHSGYEFPWSPFRLIPFSGSSTYHDFHHSNNIGNFCSFFTFWDTVFGTNSTFYAYQDRLKKEKALQENKTPGGGHSIQQQTGDVKSSKID